MTKELTKQESTELSTDISMDAFGGTQVSSKDIVIPKILCMQGLSKLVIDGEAKFGDFVDSLTSEVIGDMKKPIEFIPFHLEKILIISKKEGKDFKFDRIEPVTAMNESKRYTEVIGGEEYKNEYVMNFYSLRPDDMSMPCIVSFKGMSQKAGRQLATQMYVKNRAAGKVPPAKSMFLSGTKTQNDKGTFVTLSTKIGRDSTNEEIQECLKWYKTVASGEAKAHEEVQEAAPQYADSKGQPQF